MRPIIGLVGPSGSGKSTLINEMIRRFPDRIALKKSLTTRPKRNEEDELSYFFVTVEELRRREAIGQLVQVSEYAGNFYADDRVYLDGLLSERAGAGALVEQGILNLRNAGYQVIIIRIVPEQAETGREDKERERADAERAKLTLPADITIVNAFTPGGLEKACQDLAFRVQKWLDEI
jgi:guanylate kinase